jgi:hypothetical protein
MALDADRGEKPLRRFASFSRKCLPRQALATFTIFAQALAASKRHFSLFPSILEIAAGGSQRLKRSRVRGSLQQVVDKEDLRRRAPNIDLMA